MATGFPVLLNIQGRLCVVIGGGDVAARKAATFAERGAMVRVFSPEVCKEVHKLIEAGRAEWIKRPYQTGDLAGALLCSVTTPDPAVNQAVRDEAQKLGVLANVADDPDGSDYQVPSFFESGPLLLALSTSGASPAVARTLRRMIQGFLGPHFGQALDFISRFREEKVKVEIADSKDRVRFWEQAMTTDLLDMVRRGELLAMQSELTRRLIEFKEK